MMKTIPMFPLSILPLPGEIVPLHIFEPRYKQLLQDAEADDISFGIFCSHTLNEKKIGSLMKLESIIKRFPTGESDIIVKCYDVFTMDKLYRTFKTKHYPGADVELWHSNENESVNERITAAFDEYLEKRNIIKSDVSFSSYSIALELGIELNERYNFLLMDIKSRESFLLQRIKYQLHLLDQEERSKDLFHLN